MNEREYPDIAGNPIDYKHYGPFLDCSQGKAKSGWPRYLSANAVRFRTMLP